MSWDHQLILNHCHPSSHANPCRSPRGPACPCHLRHQAVYLAPQAWLLLTLDHPLPSLSAIFFPLLPSPVLNSPLTVAQTSAHHHLPTPHASTCPPATPLPSTCFKPPTPLESHCPLPGTSPARGTSEQPARGQSKLAPVHRLHCRTLQGIWEMGPQLQKELPGAGVWPWNPRFYCQGPGVGKEVHI